MTRKFAFLLATTGLVPFAAPAAAQTLPQGGTVVHGDAAIAAPSGGALAIDQHSSRAIIDWRSFSVGEGGRVDIRQPDAQAALLNRVTGDATSRIAGQISANGQIYLVNPNGIFITESGSVDAAGFVASTLDIGNDAFMAGEIVVTGNGGTVSNAGSITVARGGYAALIGGEVSNSGLIVAPMGKVALGAGTRATLDFEGDGFLQVALPEGAASSIAMAGTIDARGGQVILSAADARAAARSVVNMSGVIAATGVEGRDGAVRLTGGDIALSGGDIDVSGARGGGDVSLVSTRSTTIDATTTIAADATHSGKGGEVFVWSDGDTTVKGTLSARGIAEGGFVETSGASVDFAGVTVDTRAASGIFGTWLIDPYTLTVEQVHADTISDALVTTSMELKTTATGANGPGNAINDPDGGDIIINGTISWDSNATLTLSAYRGIEVNADITIAGDGGVIMQTGQGGSGGDYRFNGDASLSYTGSGGSLSIDGAAYTLIRSMDQLDAIDTADGDMAGHYALAGDLTAPDDPYDHALVGSWNPFGSSDIFTGTFTGLGHTISGLTIEAPRTDGVGLFGAASGTVRDIGLIGGSVSGDDYVGGLIGWGDSATVSNAYATGAVEGTSVLGGLIGYGRDATVSNAYAAGAVDGGSYNGSHIGGLIGLGSGATVSNAYATGAVRGNDFVGGLIGRGYLATVSNAYATGAVSGSEEVGGLIGGSYPEEVTNAYFDIDTTGQTQGLGSGPLPGRSGTGLSTADFQSGKAEFSSDAFAGGAGGLYPYLKSFFADGVEKIEGTLTNAGGPVVGAGIGFYSGGAMLASASTGDNGYYYAIVQPGSIAAGQDFGSVLTLDHGEGATGVLYASDYALVSGGSLLPTIGRFTSYGDAALYSAIMEGQHDTFGSHHDAAWASLDQFVHASGNLTLDRAITVQGGAALGLSAEDDLLIGEDITVDGTGAVTLAAGDDYRFAGASLDYGTSDRGGTLSIDGAVYDLIYSMDELDRIDSTGRGGQYALATDLDASATVYDKAVVGSGAVFSGTFTGLGHTINDLHIDAPGTNGVGLFGNASGTVRDIGLIGGQVAGANIVGGLIGHGDSATVSNAYATGAVSGNVDVGGLIGRGDSAAVSNAYATGAVSGSVGVGGLIGRGDSAAVSNAYATGAVSAAQMVGGLIGWGDNATVSNAYATGAVSGAFGGGLIGTGDSATVSNVYATGAVSGAFVGGLIGTGDSVTVSNAYATGAVKGSGSVGGLIGYGSGAMVTNAYFDVQTTGQNGGFGTGLNTAQLQNSDAIFSSDAFAGGTDGLYPYLKSFHPNGVRAITGFVQDGDGSALSAIAVSAYAGRDVLDHRGEAQIGTASSGANGYFYVLVPGDALDDAGNYSVMAGDVSDFDALLQTDRLTNDTVLSGNLLTDSVWRILTDATSLTEAFDRLGNTPGFPTSTTTFHVDHRIPGVALELEASGPFTIDDEIMFFEGGDVTIDVAAGDLTLKSGVLTGGDITLITRGAFINESTSHTPLKTREDHRWLIYSADPDANVYGTGLDSGNTAVWNTEAGDAVTQAGNRYVFALQPTITVSAADASKTYGETYDLSASYDRAGIEQGVAGAYLGDDYATILNGAPVLTSAGAAAGADAGEYAITLDGGTLSTSGGYALALGPNATLSVDRRALTISADDLSRIYGNANPDLSYTAGALVNGDTLSGSLATDANARSDVGDYAIGLGTLSAGDNYAIAFTAGTLTINPRHIDVTALGGNSIYGEAPADPGFTATNLASFDTVAALTGLASSFAIDGTTDAGSYTLTVDGALTNGNYVIENRTAGAWTVGQRALTISADDLSRIYGDANPDLTYTAGDLVNGDKLTGSLTTGVNARSDVGSYDITQGTLTAGDNYAIDFTAGTLSVTPRHIEVSALGGNSIYGEAPADPGFTATNLASFDTVAALTGLASSFGIDGTTDAGSYALTVDGTLTNGNYVIDNRTAGTWTVGQRALTISADDLSRIYGNANPVMSYTVGGMGLANDDKLNGSLSTDANAGSDVGNYAIDLGTLAAGDNYAVTFEGGTLSVTPRLLAIVADDFARAYGLSNPPLTYEIVEGMLINGDRLAGDLATEAAIDSQPGLYRITRGTLTAGGNYRLRFEPGTARIAPLRLDFVTAGMLPFVRGQSPTAIMPTVHADPIPCLPQRYCEW